MVFSSSVFLFIFLPVVLIGYYLLKESYRNFWLFITSLLFYSWGEPKYIILMLFSIISNYILGLLIFRFQKIKKIIFVITMILNLMLLIVFKYLDFIILNVNKILSADFSLYHLALPIGISFYTFQILSYIIDLYQGKVKVQKNILNLGLYISLFPQLIAGPIVRYEDVERDINSRETSYEKIYVGIKRFMIGFGKKVLIADVVAQIVDLAFEREYYSGPLCWIGMIAYTIQIYFDFSGYSDMAIGLGSMFGFNFPENFNYPYISQSIKEFWRRWHISLSTWFRDYVYIPLGGSRCNKYRGYLNLFIVFFLTGFWHGASWNFIVWGIYYAVFLIAERIFLGKVLEKIPRFLRHLYTMITVMIGWVIFRADNLEQAMRYIKGLFRYTKGDIIDTIYTLNSEQIVMLLIGIILTIPIYKVFEKRTDKGSFIVIQDTVIISIFLLAILYLVGNNFSPFLYFRF